MARLFLIFAILVGPVLAGCARTSPPTMADDIAPTAPPIETAQPPAPSHPASQQTPANTTIFPRLFLGDHEAESGEIALVVDGLAVTESEYLAGLEGQVAESGTPGAEDYDRQLRDELLILAYLRDDGIARDPAFEARARRLLRSQLAGLVLDQLVDQRIGVSDEEVRQRYEQQLDRYRQPQRVSVRLILVATSTEADDVMRRLQEGEDFAALASTVSQHSSRTTGGRLEPFSRGTYTTALEDLAFGLRTGETGTVSTNRGVFIVQKIADSPESIAPFEQVRAAIQNELLAEKRQNARREFLRRLEQEGLANDAHTTGTTAN